MRKRMVLQLFILISYVMVGCGKNTEIPITGTEKVEINVELEEEEGEKEEEEEEGEEGEDRETDEELELIENPYFPAKKHMALKVRATYYRRQGLVDEIVDAEINRLKVYENGSIYKLNINIITETASKAFPVMVRYFYVKADEIYLIWPFYQSEPNVRSISFPDDDELLLRIFDSEEELQNKGQLEPICQEENSEYEDKYWFCYMKKEGDQITYYRREMRNSGDDMQKDLFVWEKGKGLVKFETGFGPGPMEVSITEICEVMDVE